MSEYLVLLKAESLRLFGINKMLHNKDGSAKKKLGASVVGVALLGLLFLGISAIYGFLFYVTMKQTGEERYAPAFMLALASVIVFFQAIRNANGIVFGFADYETMCALPVKNKSVVMAKLTYVYLENFIFFLVFMLPVSIIYCVMSHEGILYLLRMVIGILLSPALPIALGLTIGTAFAVLAAKFKKSSIVSTVFSLIFIAVYFVFIFLMNGSDEMMVSLASNVVKIYPMSALYADGIVRFNALKFTIYVLLSVALICLYAFIISKFFTKINTAILTRKSGSGKAVKVKSSSGSGVLLKRELGKWVSTQGYVMNTIMGVIMLIVLTAIVAFKLNGITNLDQYDKADENYKMLVTALKYIKSFIPLFPILCVGMCYYCASCISIEGKSVWIIKSLPIDTREVFKAKIRVNLIITVLPSIISCVVFGVVLDLNVLEIILCSLASVAYCVTSSMFCLFVNIKKHNYDWQSPAEVFKRGTSATICSFASMLVMIPLVLILLLCGLVASVLGITATYICYSVLIVIFTVLNILLGRYLSHGGVRDFLKN